MEDIKLEEILEKVISKTSDMLDETFAKFDHSLRNDIVNLRNDLNSVKELCKKELSKVRECVNDIEDGQKFIEKEFEDQKEKIKDMIKDNKKMFSENQRLHNEIRALYQSQEENQTEINKLAEYNRSSFMLELSGIPRQDDENAIDLVSKTAVVAGISNFDVSQIDIAHRVSGKGTELIIVLFNRKADRTNFYRQKKKLFKVRANHIVKPNNNEDHSGSEVSLPGFKRENSYIYLNKTLTSMNRMSLREARKESKRLKYEFPGYTVNSEVRVKKSKSSEYIPVNSKHYLVG